MDPEKVKEADVVKGKTVKVNHYCDNRHELKVAYCGLTIAKNMKDVEAVRRRIGDWLLNTSKRSGKI